jgi:hypothetical protein
VSSFLGGGGMRVGVVGPAGPDRFADNIGDALGRAGHAVTKLKRAGLRAQATRLLNETGLTERLGDAAAARAHRDHSYDLRVATILEKVS